MFRERLLTLFVLGATLVSANEYQDLEPSDPILKKVCTYSGKNFGSNKMISYSIYEDKVSDKVVIFSKKAEKLYTTKSEMVKHSLYDCKTLMPILLEMGE